MRIHILVAVCASLALSACGQREPVLTNAQRAELCRVFDMIEDSDSSVLRTQVALLDSLDETKGTGVIDVDTRAARKSAEESATRNEESRTQLRVVCGEKKPQ